ncbi:MAG: hypothetical protein IKR25_07550 [Muribaculaceae bacterium]|nr:hypothetical protein [Muribaculaceae bacterium]
MKTLIFILLALSSAVAAAGSGYEYVPLVREGVSWNYLFFELNPDYSQDYDFYYQYSLTFKGDSVINGKSYEKCLCTFEGQTYIVAFVREADKVVYGLRCESGCQSLRQDHHLLVAPNLVPGAASWWYGNYPFLPWDTREGEVAMYDFNLSDATPGRSLIEVCGAERYALGGWFIEGVGPYVGEGNILDTNQDLTTNIDPHTVGLVSVVQSDGTMEYAGSAYPLVYPHDLNIDGVVDIEDVAAVINTILQSGLSGSGCGISGDGVDTPAYNADVNGDGVVDIDDVNIVISTMLK